jgi:hypothetical protein
MAGGGEDRGKQSVCTQLDKHLTLKMKCEEALQLAGMPESVHRGDFYEVTDCQLKKMGIDPRSLD